MLTVEYTDNLLKTIRKIKDVSSQRKNKDSDCKDS